MLAPSSHPQSDARRFLLAGALLIVAGLALRWTSLHAGWFLDDYVQHSMLDGNMWLKRGMWDLHVPAKGNDAAELIRRGALPWWSEPTMVFAPFRPLTSVFMWWQYHHLDRDPVALHAVSFVLWALFAAVTLTSYVRTVPRRAAFIAATVFVLSPSHTEAVSWVASQSLLVSAMFGSLALVLYVAFRRSGSLWHGAGHVLAYVCALLAGEHGLTFAGYLCAYEIFCSRDLLRKRVQCLAPAGLASVLYLSWSALGGYGARGMSYYADVLSSPAHLWETVRTSLPQHVVHGLAGRVFSAGEPGMAGWALLTLTLVLVLLRTTGLVRGMRPSGPAGRAACAWLAGALLSTVPYGAATFSVRLGVIPQMGFAAALGVILGELLTSIRASSPRSPSTWALAAVAAYLTLAHVAYAGYESHARSQRLAKEYRICATRAARVKLVGPGRAEPSHVFVMSTFHVAAAQTTGLARVAEGRPYALWRVLSPAFGPHILVRTSDRSFTLRTTTPGIFSNISALVYRKLDSPLEEGTTIETEELTVRVLERGGAGPSVMEFTFAQPLESPEYRFVLETPHGFEPFPLPPPGQHTIVPPVLPPAGLL